MWGWWGPSVEQKSWVVLYNYIIIYCYLGNTRTRFSNMVVISPGSYTTSGNKGSNNYSSSSVNKEVLLQ